MNFFGTHSLTASRGFLLSGKTRTVFVVCLFALCLVFSSVHGSRLKPKRFQPVSLSDELEEAFDDPLSLQAKDIVKNYAINKKPASERVLSDVEVLGYVTPWNNRGYDVAKQYSKFSMISPVWIRLAWNGRQFVFEGLHDIDSGWMVDVRNASKIAIKMIPRVQINLQNAAGWNALWNQKLHVSSMIHQLCTAHKFDGITLEIWDEIPYDIAGDYKEAVDFVKVLYKTFQKTKKKLVLIVPPIAPDNMQAPFKRNHYRELLDHVDYFSFMTYDLASDSGPGPVSSLRIFKQCINIISEISLYYEHKVLIGLNFYGRFFSSSKSGDAIVGRDYIALLQKHNPKIHWSEEDAEHFINYEVERRKHVAYYPTIHSLKQRINVITEAKFGIAIWELGQGLDYFYDLL